MWIEKRKKSWRPNLEFDDDDQCFNRNDLPTQIWSDIAYNVKWSFTFQIKNGREVLSLLKNTFDFFFNIFILFFERWHQNKFAFSFALHLTDQPFFISKKENVCAKRWYNFLFLGCIAQIFFSRRRKPFYLDDVVKTRA